MPQIEAEIVSRIFVLLARHGVIYPLYYIPGVSRGLKSKLLANLQVGVHAVASEIQTKPCVSGPSAIGRRSGRPKPDVPSSDNKSDF